MLPSFDHFVIRPIHDVGFKALFGHPFDPDCLLLRDFLESIYHKHFDILEFQDREITPEQILSKSIRLDLRLHCDMIYYNLEMQMIPTGSEAERALYYVSLSIQDQTLQGKLYSDIEPVVQVFLLGENTRKFLHPVLHYELVDSEYHTLLTDKIKITMISIKRVIEKITDFNRMSEFEKWCVFFEYGHDENHTFTQRLLKEDKFRKAVNIMKHVNRDKALKEAAFVKMREEMDQRTRLYNADKEGEQRGLHQGIMETMKVIHLLKQGDSPEIISQQVSLTLTEIKEISRQMEEPVSFAAKTKSEPSLQDSF